MLIDVSVVKRIDKATPLLLTRCVDGTVLPLVTVQLTRADGQTYLKYELKNVMVSSFSHGGDLDGDGLPDETIALALTGAKLTYTQFDATGKPIGQTSAQWQAPLEKPFFAPVMLPAGARRHPPAANRWPIEHRTQ